MAKETYLEQKSLMYMAKKTYLEQKRIVYMAKETYFGPFRGAGASSVCAVA